MTTVAPPLDVFRYAHDHFHEIVWMSQNTNHLFPSGPVEEAIAKAVKEKRYQSYPYAPGDPTLKELVRKDFGLTDCEVGIASGGTEALYMLTRGLLSAQDEVIASDPSYLIIHKFIELSGARTVNLPIYAPPYRLTPDRVNEAVTPKTRMILLIDPLNPLGSGYPKEDVRAIAEIAKDHKLLLLNDTTYRDFADAHTLAHPFYPEGTVTVWSVSKNCGLAGVRLGGLLARKELYDRIWKYNTNDLGVNVLSQAAAVAALQAKPKAFPAVARQTRENQKRIHDAAKGWKGVSLPVYPSQGNMFVLDVAERGVDPEALQRELLLNHGVFLRAGNYLSPTSGKRFIRASFSNVPADIDRFLKAFPLALETLSRPPPKVAAAVAGR
ncbi:MAG: pyridoxal phosphate-dependent aminotransferase [Euryarchaeota archaeon]|nr:pyridoxal phosphate-dependent aminotransferase [Euryarchaeota archaeon]MDE1837011.1 pyridoxal phosphate-dependent aminotransferase [Euryarchaeota archaeon]MDE1879861.1 pyridoxal phosphate-dependent aminotransferase [Euryarchaeota archaeon]MDE2045669.1 pyridoxal phosphate-dependent aminotransferase [Thermoplasmata archaeon]